MHSSAHTVCFLCAQHKFTCPPKLWRLFLSKSSAGSHGNNRSPLKHGLTFPSTWILSPLWVLGSNACIPSDVFGGVTTCTSNKPSNRHALRILPTWQMHSLAIHLWCVKSPGTCAFRLFDLNAEVLQSLPGPLILILDRRPSEISDFNCMSPFWRHNEIDEAFFEGLKAAERLYGMLQSSRNILMQRYKYAAGVFEFCMWENCGMFNIVGLYLNPALKHCEIHSSSVCHRYGGEHKAPELQKEAVYGLTEIYRDEVKEARLIANPGCYPTSVQLPLYPLLKVRHFMARQRIPDHDCRSVNS